jgi:hypothetical protein
MEAERSTGMMVLAFDDELRGHEQGNQLFPVGSYNYERSTSFSLMLADFKQRLEREDFKLQGRPVMILGTPENAQLPIACGLLSLTIEEETPTESPSRPSPVRVRPRPTEEPETPVDPEPKPEEHRGFWGRLRDRLERWWDRWFGRRGEENLYFNDNKNRQHLRFRDY